MVLKYWESFEENYSLFSLPNLLTGNVFMGSSLLWRRVKTSLFMILKLDQIFYGIVEVFLTFQIPSSNAFL